MSFFSPYTNKNCAEVHEIREKIVSKINNSKYLSDPQSVLNYADNSSFYLDALRAIKCAVSPEVKIHFHLVSLENKAPFKISHLNWRPLLQSQMCVSYGVGILFSVDVNWKIRFAFLLRQFNLGQANPIIQEEKEIPCTCVLVKVGWLIGEIVEVCLYIHVMNLNSQSLLFIWPADGPSVLLQALLPYKVDGLNLPRGREKPGKRTHYFSGFVLLLWDWVPAMFLVMCCKVTWSCW